jgi:hypothetical protein
MAPKLVVDVEATNKDALDDVARVGTIAATAYLVNNYLLQTPGPNPFLSTLQTIMVCVGGLAVYNLVVDSLLVRFAVHPTQETYYAAQKRM